MTIYFRNYTEKIYAVCQKKTSFVFNDARAVFAQKILV